MGFTLQSFPLRSSISFSSNSIPSSDGTCFNCRPPPCGNLFDTFGFSYMHPPPKRQAQETKNQYRNDTDGFHFTTRLRRTRQIHEFLPEPSDTLGLANPGDIRKYRWFRQNSSGTWRYLRNQWPTPASEDALVWRWCPFRDDTWGPPSPPDSEKLGRSWGSFQNLAIPLVFSVSADIRGHRGTHLFRGYLMIPTVPSAPPDIRKCPAQPGRRYQDDTFGPNALRTHPKMPWCDVGTFTGMIP